MAGQLQSILIRNRLCVRERWWGSTPNGGLQSGLPSRSGPETLCAWMQAPLCAAMGKLLRHMTNLTVIAAGLTALEALADTDGVESNVSAGR